MKIIDIREKPIPISSPIRNAYIDFSRMTLSLVAVLTDVMRYGQGALMRERFIPRIVAADPAPLVNGAGENRDSVRQGAVAVRPVLVGGNRRSARLRAAGGDGPLLGQADGDRRKPVLDGRGAQPDPNRLRRQR